MCKKEKEQRMFIEDFGKKKKKELCSTMGLNWPFKNTTSATVRIRWGCSKWMTRAEKVRMTRN